MTEGMDHKLIATAEEMIDLLQASKETAEEMTRNRNITFLTLAATGTKSDLKHHAKEY